MTTGNHPWRTLPWPGPAIIDVCFVQAATGQLLALTEDGALFNVDLGSGARTRRCSLTLPDLPYSKNRQKHYGRHRLHASADGEYAAVVVDAGVEGMVVRCSTGEVTMRLNGGNYYSDTVSFSTCFVRYDERDVLIHRTDWNRLEASDPATGKLLTRRPSTCYDDGQPEPAHYLDYFHGQLVPSPNGSRLFDSGWIWQPYGAPCAWSITDWLDTNPFESEDGASKRYLAMRDNWDELACWIDEHHIALWGLIDWNEDENEEAWQGMGVQISDVTEGKHASSFDRDGCPPARKLPLPIENHVFALPNGGGHLFWTDGEQLFSELADIEHFYLVNDLFSDGKRLFVATKTGTSAWDIATGTQCANFEGFVARLHNRKSGLLVSIAPDAIGILDTKSNT